MARRTTPQEKTAIALFSDFLPRQCGIATFTSDLCEAVAACGGGKSEVFVVATNDIDEGYAYSDRVRFEIRQPVLADYRLAADFLNMNQVAGVFLQHEYGIYGGACGSHLLVTLRRLRRPVVTTLHTVLKEPSVQQRRVLAEVARFSDRIVVMSQAAMGMLQEIYDVPAEKIAHIHHGIPDMPFVDPNFYKDQFGVEGKKVLLTFGLLSPGKGLEYVIDAMPEIVRRHGDVVYVVLGATHPQIRRESGERYRNELIGRAEALGVRDKVLFVNRFVQLRELCEYLGAADLYVTPYLSEAQITSGTLAYALGAGKAIVSTPYWYAQEMLADGRGRLVPFRDSAAIAREVNDLLDNETARHAMRKKAYNYCRQMLWCEVGKQYLELFEQARGAWLERLPRVMAAQKEDCSRLKTEELPEPDLRHLRVMTDHTGVLQHCLFSTPDRNHGYCTDDNARALMASAMYADQSHDLRARPLIQTYLSFLTYALDAATGRFRNSMGYDRRWSEVMGSEDSHARALQALGTAVALCPDEPTIALSSRLFLKALPVTESFASPRAWAFTILGIHEYLRRFGGDSEARRYRVSLTDRLARHFTDNMSGDWPWCENVVTYENAALPHALLMSGKWLQRGELIDLAKRTLGWLLQAQTAERGHLSLIGTEGWLPRGGRRAVFDQQPLEAHTLLAACVEAFRVTRETWWLDQARKAFRWFLGDNDLRVCLYDFTTGGCRDGLHADRVNENQGAESTIAWLLSVLLMNRMQEDLTLGEVGEKSVEHRAPAETSKTGEIPAGVETGESSRSRGNDQ